MTTTIPSAQSEGPRSILDTDLYKLTMQCAVLQHFPQVSVAYQFTNRTPHMKLNRRAYEWLLDQVRYLQHIQLTDGELQWLRKTCPYLNEDYLAFLADFRYCPSEHIHLSLHVSDEHSGLEAVGDLSLSVKGRWVDTILYEIPLLALISEAYFKFIDRDWSYDGQLEGARKKGLALLEHGCTFSEFGTRRRRDYHTHELVVEGLLQARETAAETSAQGNFLGTSNVHMAMRFGLNPIGTVAHEWFMAIAAIFDDYAAANEQALGYWIKTFGRGVLGIALTDTFGTPAFLRAFAKRAPHSAPPASAPSIEERSYAEIFTGVRQDSGDPLIFLDLMRNFYASHQIAEKKLIVYSDSLNVEKCIEYKAATDAAGLIPSFGIGTFFTNDFVQTSTGNPSAPLNIVIKVSEAEGRPAVKLSDDTGKHMGESELVGRIKASVGYADRSWADEAKRWDPGH